MDNGIILPELEIQYCTGRWLLTCVSCIPPYPIHQVDSDGRRINGGQRCGVGGDGQRVFSGRIHLQCLLK